MKLSFAAGVLSVAFAASAAAQQVAFTFDDLPSHGELPPGQTRMGVIRSILATIRQQKLPPVYGFMNGLRVEEKPETLAVLNEWRAAGQPLGSHSYSHMSLNEHTAAEYEGDIEKNEPVLSSLMSGQDWHWFRYPFLWEGDTLDKRHAIRVYLRQHGYEIAHVSLDFEDYLWNDPYARCSVRNDQDSIEWLRTSYLATADQYITLFRDAAHTLYGHDIPYVLLMHVGAFDARMLPELIELFRRRGFTFTTLPQASKDPAYSAEFDIPFRYDGTIQEQALAARHLKFPPNTKPYKHLEAICR